MQATVRCSDTRALFLLIFKNLKSAPWPRQREDSKKIEIHFSNTVYQYSYSTVENIDRMGHLNHIGFSSQLLSTIADCRAKAEQWVEREKQAADEMEQKYRAILSQEQSTIDALGEDLLALKFKLGINVKDKEGYAGSESQDAGIVQQQENLLEDQEQLQAIILKLKTERDTKDGIVKRKSVLLMFHMESMFRTGRKILTRTHSFVLWMHRTGEARGKGTNSCC